MPRRKNTGGIPLAVQNFDKLPDAALVDVRAVAILLGVTTDTVYRWSRDGRLTKPEKIGPNSSRFRVGPLRRAMSQLSA
jgi:predicted DNA-binding transcriptional regulator AlpA